MGRPFRVQPTTSMQHARELAREACDAGEIVAAMGGDGIVGAVAGELRDGKGLLAVLPGGRGNDFARKLGIPFDPVEAVALLADRRRDARRPRRRRRDDVPGHPQRRDRLRRQPDRARDAPEARHVRLHLRRAARDRRPGARRRGSSRSTARPSAFDGYSVAVCNSGVFGGGMYLAPDARARRRAARRGADRRAVQGPLHARAAARVQGHAPAGPRGPLRAVPRGDLRGRAAVHRLRRRRPDRRAAGHGPRAARARCGWWRRDDAPGRRCGRREGGRHARAHGRARRRDVAAGQGAHARRAARDRPAGAPAGPRQRRDQRHQRQDDDRGDGGEHPRAHRRAARPQPRRGEHGGRDRERAGRAPAAAAAAR